MSWEHRSIIDRIGRLPRSVIVFIVIVAWAGPVGAAEQQDLASATSPVTIIDATCCDPPRPSGSSTLLADRALPPERAAAGPAWLFDTSGFPSRWSCGTWSTFLGWLHIGSDIAIWAAYMAIPLVLAFFVLKGRMPIPSVTWLFIAFIASCGIGHLIEAVIFWHPVYRLAGVWKLVTALVSCITVVVLVPLVPKVLKWPTLGEINKRLRAEIEDRRAAERKIAEANARLAAANSEMEQFVYTVSHDLKSPLVTILGYSGFLQRDLQDDRRERLGEFATQIDEASRRMRQTIDDLLQVSRVGRVAHAQEWIDVASQAKELAKQMQLQVAEASAIVQVDDDIPNVWGDPIRIRHALENLLANALKYGRHADRPCRVRIGGVRAGDEVRLFVADNGPGVPEEHHETIFELFQRFATAEEGTGIGLTIVKRVAEIHGGRAWVESGPAGATFFIAVPASASEQASRPAA